jgi:hypothetical protein
MSSIPGGTTVPRGKTSDCAPRREPQISIDVGHAGVGYCRSCEHRKIVRCSKIDITGMGTQRPKRKYHQAKAMRFHIVPVPFTVESQISIFRFQMLQLQPLSFTVVFTPSSGDENYILGSWGNRA